MEARILIVILSIPFVQGYLIERRIDHNSWNTLPDHIIIPDSMCILGGAILCNAMNATKTGHCRCKCKDSSHTFFFLNGKWNCVDNEQVRQITGCTTKVTSNKENGSEIFTVPTSPNSIIEYIASIPGFNSTKCGFYRPSSYMLCNGSWARWSGVNIFNMAGSVNATITPSPNIGLSHYGQVLRLVVDCYFTSWQDPDESFCILFKVEGKRNCPRTTESSTASPVTTLSVTTLSVPASPSTSVPSTKSLPGPTTTQYSTIETTTNRVRTIPSTDNQRSSSAPRYILKTTTIPPLIKKTSNPPTADSRSSLIAGATVAAVISILIIIIIVVMILGIRRRKSRRSSTAADGTGNEGYTSNGTVSFQLSPKGDEEYSYAYHDAPIQKPNAVKGNQGYTSNGTVSFQLSPKGDEEYSYAYHDAPIQKPNAVKETQHYMPLQNRAPHVYGTLVRPSNKEGTGDGTQLQSNA